MGKVASKEELTAEAGTKVGIHMTVSMNLGKKVIHLTEVTASIQSIEEIRMDLTVAKDIRVMYPMVSIFLMVSEFQMLVTHYIQNQMGVVMFPIPGEVNIYLDRRVKAVSMFQERLVSLYRDWISITNPEIGIMTE